MTTRWLFGDQLGPHFVDDHRGPLLMVESTGVFRRRRFHRAKAHLVLSAMRHRAAELGDRLTYVQAETYAEAVREVGGDVEVVHPTSYAALGLVERLGCTVLPPRGFATAREDFERWAEGRRGKRLLMEDFYRRARQAHGVLLDGGEPAGGQWNFDHDNREPPPKGADTLGVTEPWWPSEDDIDAQVREDLDRWERDGEVSFIGRDSPRIFPATRRQALAALEHFVEHRLPEFGAHEDAILEGDPWMAHSLVSAPMNLGLLDPLEVVERAEAGLPRRRGADRERRGLRPPGHRVARLRLARLLAHGRRLPPRERAGRTGSGSRSGSPSSTVRRPTRAASPTPSTRSRSTAGCTTSRGSWCWGRTPCSAGGRRRRSPTGSTGPSSTATTG